MGCSSSKDALLHQEVAKEVAKQVAESELVKGAGGNSTNDDPSKRRVLGYPEGPTLEELRLRALQTCRVLDTPAEARFDNITKLLTSIFQVPMALVSLIDADRLVFHSGSGPVGPGGARIHSFCDASLKAHNPTMMVVEDTLEDARFQHSQFVEGPPHVRFYSGAPLVSSEGYVMGSLGILDLVPRKFPADMLNMICNFAELVVRELERDKVLELQKQRTAVLEAHQQHMVRALSCFSEAVIMVDLTSSDVDEWRILYVNDSWGKLTELSFETSLKLPFWSLLELDGTKAEQAAKLAAARDAISRKEPFTMHVTVRGAPQVGRLHLRLRPGTNDHLGTSIPLIGIPNFVEPTGNNIGYNASHYFAIAKPVWPTSASPKGVLQPPGSAETASEGLTPLSSGGVSSGDTSPGGSVHACFGIERPAELEGLKLGPMLGKGSYGKVYRGFWRGSQVAVKVLDVWVDKGAGAREGAMMEAVLGRELSHPHIVQTFEFASRMEEAGCETQQDRDRPLLAAAEPPHNNDANAGGAAKGGGAGDGEVTTHQAANGGGGASGAVSGGAEEGAAGAQGGQPPAQLCVQRMWIIQQYCNSGTLYDAIDRGWLRAKRDLDGPVNLWAILQTAQEIASAMSFLHSRGILHCDLTGNNVLLQGSTTDPRRFAAHVSDFGLSRVLTSEEPIKSGAVGTVSHMPPEALSDGTITKAVDVFSFGVLLWEMYCQQRAWCGHSAPQIIFFSAQGERLEFSPGTPPGYKELAEACMSRHREQRPTFDAVLGRVEGLLKTAKGGSKEILPTTAG